MEKAEKIRTEDISIGDWLQARMVKWDYEDLDITPPMRVAEISSDEVMLQLGSVKHYAFVDDLQPIPITAEVLEKSGFIHDKWSKQIWIYEDEESEVVYYIECSRLEIITDKCKMYITCKGVAELQRALRLTKVEKEIVL